MNAQDNGLVRALAYGDGIDPINPSDPVHVRADVVTDGKIDYLDEGLVEFLASQGVDGTGISCP